MAEGKQNTEVVDVRWHAHAVSRADREHAAGHKGCVLWFTGLSGCGKSTLANCVDRKLHERGCRTFVLDGDNVRHGLSAAPALLVGDAARHVCAQPGADGRAEREDGEGHGAAVGGEVIRQQ